MSIVTEQHISAQVWTCTRCGGEDPKSCGCAAATATSREIQAKVERLAAKDEGSRQRQRAYRERKTALHNAPVENIEKSPEARKQPTVTLPGIFAETSCGLPVNIPGPIVVEASGAGRELAVNSIIVALAGTDTAIRSAIIEALTSGTRQTEFDAVREAVADLYERLSKVGK